ncbi:uncharacterized protein METZ01_LOCUS342497, partial [marine metagenome]
MIQRAQPFGIVRNAIWCVQIDCLKWSHKGPPQAQALRHSLVNIIGRGLSLCE